MKRHEKTISHEKAVHIAALVSDLWNVSKKVIQRDLKAPEVIFKKERKKEKGKHLIKAEEVSIMKFNYDFI